MKPPSEVVSAEQFHADEISVAWQKSVAGILETCEKVIAAKAELDHGQFLRMFSDHDNPIERPVPFGERTGRMLASIGSNELLTNRKFTSALPPSWMTLYNLTRLDDLPERLESGEITPELKQKDAARWLALQRHEKRKEVFAEGAASKGEQWEMREGDFREVLADLEPGSVDAVLTDPPYPDEFLPLWADLGELAAKVLRPGGVLIAWSGQIRLPEILSMLSEHLKYGWTMALDLPGSQAKFVGANVFQTWKPIIVYTKEKWPPHDWGEDRFTSPAREKGEYEWQQTVEPAMDVLDRFVAPGGLVVDPFTGVGSFGLATLKSGRRFIGAELDPERAESARRKCESLHD